MNPRPWGAAEPPEGALAPPPPPRAQRARARNAGPEARPGRTLRPGRARARAGGAGTADGRTAASPEEAKGDHRKPAEPRRASPSASRRRAREAGSPEGGPTPGEGRPQAAHPGGCPKPSETQRPSADKAKAASEDTMRAVAAQRPPAAARGREGPRGKRPGAAGRKPGRESREAPLNVAPLWRNVGTASHPARSPGGMDAAEAARRRRRAHRSGPGPMPIPPQRLGFGAKPQCERQRTMCGFAAHGARSAPRGRSPLLDIGTLFHQDTSPKGL